MLSKMDLETRLKIEETVLDILRKADMEAMTEFKLRLLASERLGFDFSQIECKRLVRSLVESFLLFNPEENVPEHAKELPQKELDKRPEKEVNEDGGRLICKLSSKRSVLVQDFRGKTLVSIREYYQKDGMQIPTPKGISLSAEQWSSFKKSIPAIEEAIMQMTSRLRCENDGEEIEENSNSKGDLAPQELALIGMARFDGKNYHSWVSQMHLLLLQLGIVYVLTESCPSGRTQAKDSGQFKAAELKWINDDYMARRNILSSLSDNLYHQFVHQSLSAKDLWEELKFVYLYEAHGTKRTQVKRYIEFEIVEEKSIILQVQEFNSLADSIGSNGMMIDEKFHVSVIISKLPPSWKDVYNKLLCKEYLPFRILMDHLKEEEELRNQNRIGVLNNPMRHHSFKDHVPRMGGMRLSGSHPKNRGQEMPSRDVVCYNCGQRGHISRNCGHPKFDKEITHEKIGGVNESSPSVTKVNMLYGTE